MLISHAHRFIFVHNPKAAGTAFRTAIGSCNDDPHTFWGFRRDPFLGVYLDLAHIRLWEAPAVAPSLAKCLRDYKSLVFIRAPVDRFLSSCFHYFRSHKRHININSMEPNEQRAVIEHFILNDLTAMKILSDYRYVHFSPQKWFVYVGDERLVQHVLPVRRDEDFERAFDILNVPKSRPANRNRNTPAQRDQLRSASIVEFVQQYYAMDIEMMNSLPDLGSLVDV